MVKVLPLLKNIYFVKPIAHPSSTFSGIMNLKVKGLYIGGQRMPKCEL